jgi:hypothetical protein
MSGLNLFSSLCPQSSENPSRCNKKLSQNIHRTARDPAPCTIRPDARCPDARDGSPRWPAWPSGLFGRPERSGRSGPPRPAGYRSPALWREPGDHDPGASQPCGRAGWPRPPRMPRRSRRPSGVTGAQWPGCACLRPCVRPAVHAVPTRQARDSPRRAPLPREQDAMWRMADGQRTARDGRRAADGMAAARARPAAPDPLRQTRSARPAPPDPLRQPAASACCASPARRKRIKRTPSNDSHVARRIPPTRRLGYGMKSHMRYYGSGATARLAGTQLRKRIADTGHFWAKVLYKHV